MITKKQRFRRIMCTYVSRVNGVFALLTATKIFPFSIYNFSVCVNMRHRSNSKQSICCFRFFSSFFASENQNTRFECAFRESTYRQASMYHQQLNVMKRVCFVLWSIVFQLHTRGSFTVKHVCTLNTKYIHKHSVW